jgi:hypothetical protein
MRRDAKTAMAKTETKQAEIADKRRQLEAASRHSANSIRRFPQGW